MEPTTSIGCLRGNLSIFSAVNIPSVKLKALTRFQFLHFHFILFFRENQHNPQVIVNGNVNSIYNSNYRANRPLYVVVHEWNGSGGSDMNPLITSNILAVQDANVIVVDWSRVAEETYINAARGVPSVGQFLGNFITWVINTTGGNWNQVHFIGFNLGAHIVGNAGRQTGSRPSRITG